MSRKSSSETQAESGWNVSFRAAADVARVDLATSKTIAMLVEAFTDLSLIIYEYTRDLEDRRDYDARVLNELGRDLEDGSRILSDLAQRVRKTFERLRKVSIGPGGHRLATGTPLLPRPPRASPVRDLQSGFQRVGRLSFNLAELVGIARDAGDPQTTQRAKSSLGALQSFLDTLGAIAQDVQRGGLIGGKSGQYRLGITAKRLPP